MNSSHIIITQLSVNLAIFRHYYIVPVKVLTNTINSNFIISMAQQVLGIIHTAAFKPLRHVTYRLALVNDLSTTSRQTDNLHSQAMPVSNVYSGRKSSRNYSEMKPCCFSVDYYLC